MKIDWDKLAHKASKFSEGGWRRLFFWVSAGTMAIALPTVYVYNPWHGEYAPVEYLGKLNDTMLIVLGLAGIRGVEKFTQRQGATA